jgi:hypothetical protein
VAEQITTAAELDALPMGSAAVDSMGDAWMKITATEWATQETAVFTSKSIARKWSPFTVVYRPDRDLLAEAEARGAKATWQAAADLVSGMVPVHFELRPDGREDPYRGAYANALQDAHGLLTDRAHEGEPQPADPWAPLLDGAR